MPLILVIVHLFWLMIIIGIKISSLDELLRNRNFDTVNIHPYRKYTIEFA